MKLGDICSKIGSGATPRGGKDSYKDSGTAIIRSQNVLDWSFSSSGLAFIDDDQSKALSNVEVKQGDVLLNITGDSVARACMVPSEFLPARVNQHVAIIRANEEANNLFLLAWLQANKGTLLKLASSGATRNALTKRMLENLDVNLPPIDVQDKAAAFIDSIQAKIALNTKLNGYLEELFDLIFQRLIDDAGSDWDTASLLDIADYKNGLAMQKFRPDTGDEGLPVLKIRELGQGFCGSDAERCKSGIVDSAKVHDGDLIFSWSGTLLLDFWAGGNAGLNQHLFKVTSSAYPSWFYYGWTKHHLARFIMLAKDRATTMGHIKRSALAESEVVIPPENILLSQTQLMQPIIDQYVMSKIEARKLAVFRDSLLPKLMSGEIDVSEVNLTQLNSHLA